MGIIPDRMKDARRLRMGSGFVTAIFNTAVILLIARNAGPDIGGMPGGPQVLGALGFMLAFMGVFAFIGDMGYGLAFERVLAKGYGFNDCLRAFMMAKARLTAYMGVTMGIMIGAYAYFLAPPPDTTVLEPISLVLILGYFLVANLASIWVVSMKSHKRGQTPYDLMEAFAKFVLVICLLFLMNHGVGEVLVFQVSFIYLVAATLGMMLARNSARGLRKGRGNEEVEVEFLDTSKRFIPFIALGALLLNLDKVSLWLASDLNEVGMFFGAQRITIFIGASAVTIELLLGEAISRYVAENKNEEISETLRMTERYVSLVVLPITAFYVMFSDTLLGAFLGEGFAGGGTVVALLAGAGLFAALASPHMSYLLRADRLRELYICMGLGLAALLGALALLLPDLVLPNADVHGRNGAAIAVLASSITTYACARFLTWRILGCRPHRRMLAHVLSAGLMVAVMHFAIWYFSIEMDFLRLVAFAILGFFVYVMCLYLTGEMVREDFLTFKELTKTE